VLLKQKKLDNFNKRFSHRCMLAYIWVVNAAYKIALSIPLAFYPPWKNTPEISKGKTHTVNDNSKHDSLSLLEIPGP